MKKLLCAVIVLMFLAGCKEQESNQPVNGASESDQLTQEEIDSRQEEAKSKLVEKFGLEASVLSEPTLYDITNDGRNEIVLYSEKELTEDPYYIAAYSLENGEELFAEKYESFEAIRIKQITNPTYKNSIAVLSFGGTAAYTAEILAFQDQALKSVTTFSSEYGESESVIADVDQNGFHDFRGQEYDYGPGSDRLSRANGIVSEIAYFWNEESKSYEVSAINVSGESDASTALSQQNALQIVQSARQVQSSWINPLATEEAVHQLMRPLFSNNFIYEFLQDGVLHEEYGYLPLYTESGDTSWLVPEFTQEAELILDSSGEHASLVQDIELGYEGATSTLQAVTLFAKTMAGWRIDKLEYRESAASVAAATNDLDVTGYWSESGGSNSLQLSTAENSLLFNVCSEMEVTAIPLTIVEITANRVVAIPDDGESDDLPLIFQIQDGKLTYTMNSVNVELVRNTADKFYQCLGVDTSKQNYEYTFGGITIGDTEQFLLNTLDEQLTKDAQGNYTVNSGFKTQFYVANGKVAAIMSEDESYKLINGIGIGSTVKQVRDSYSQTDFRQWEDSRIITAKMSGGVILGFDFGMGGGDLLPEDSALKIVLFEENFFKELYSESYDEKMKNGIALEHFN